MILTISFSFYEKQKLKPKILFKDLIDKLRSLLDHESNVKNFLSYLKSYEENDYL
jgi:hypothetical protein